MVAGRVLWVVLLAFLAGCASVKVTSNPAGADVSVLLPGKEEVRLLGQTPFDAKIEDIKGNVSLKTVVIRVSKPGYATEHFVLPDLSLGDVSINFSFRPNSSLTSVEMSKMISLAFRAENLLIEKQPEEALKIAEQIMKMNENISAVFHIEGAAHFMRKDYEKSRLAWQRAVELEPDNVDAQAMLKTVLDLIAGGQPATPAK